MTAAQAATLRWTDWQIDPLIVVGLLGGSVAWRWITLRFAARPRQALLGWSALVILALSLLSPLERGAGHSFTLHMAQHVILMMIVAPLLALGTPPAFLGWLRRRPVAGWIIKAIWAPAPAFVLYHAALFLWHVPSLSTPPCAARASIWCSTLPSSAPPWRSGGSWWRQSRASSARRWDTAC